VNDDNGAESQQTSKINAGISCSCGARERCE
jgi:hypothetical protein